MTKEEIRDFATFYAMTHGWGKSINSQGADWCIRDYTAGYNDATASLTTRLKEAEGEIERLNEIVNDKEQQRQEWFELCIRYKKKIEGLSRLLREFCDCPEIVIENPSMLLDCIGRPISSETLAWAEEIIKQDQQLPTSKPQTK